MELMNNLIQFFVDNAMFLILIILLVIIPEGRWLAVMLTIGNILSDGNIPTILYAITLVVGILLTIISPRIRYSRNYQKQLEKADQLLMSLLEREQAIRNIEIKLGNIIEIDDTDDDYR